MTLRQTSFLVITALGVVMVIASAFFVSTGFFLIDEVIYMLSADVFLDTGSFIIQNGYETYGSEDQKWMDLLSVGPQGLTPQYPVGSAVVGALFVGLFDQHGFFVMNALAAFATLFVTRALALELFEDERVALGAVLLLVFGSYFTEYAFGLWPHMVSVLSVTTSFWLFLRALRQDSPFVGAMLSGLVLGAGLLFRVDGVLLLPVIALLTILYAAKPLIVFAGGAAGLIPGFAAMAYANSLKFGTWNPISYGANDYASEDPLKYIGLIGLSVVGVLAAILMRSTTIAPRRIWLLPLAVAVAAAIFLIPQASTMASRIARGIMGLVVDATTITDPRPGVQAQEDGTLLFWGLPKKAIGQSLPWLGGILLLLGWSWGEKRRAITCILIFALIWMFPFVIRSWHGGLSLNMRYFLPLLPPLCILTAWIMKELIGTGVPRFFPIAIAVGFVGSSVWALVHPSSTAGAHQILPTYVFLGICAVALLAGFARQKWAPIALFFIALGVGQAASIAATDIIMAQSSRSDEMFDFSQDTDKDVVFDIFARSVYRDPNQIFALPHWRNATADPEFVAAALSDGYRILMHEDRAVRFVQTYPQFTVLADVPIQTIPFQSIGLR